MKQNIGIILLTCVLAIVGCKNQNGKSTDHNKIDTTAILRSIDSLGAVVQKAHTTGDKKLLASTWAEDGIFINCQSEPVRGRDAIVTALTNMPPLPPGSNMTVHPLEIQVLSKDWAYVFGVDSLKIAMPGATTPVVSTMSFLVIVKKTKEGWQTYRETLSPNSNPGNRDL